MGHVRDRWTDPNPNGGRRVRNGRWGKGKRWQARWVEGGRECSRACATKDEAERIAAEKDLGIVRASVSSATVRERMEVWQASRIRHKPATIDTVQSALDSIILPTLGDRPVAELDRAELQQAVTEWSKRWAPTRVRVAWSFLSGMLTQCEQDRIIDRRPAGIVLPRIDPAPVVPLTVEQVGQIADRVPGWWNAMVILGAASGLRSGELRGLTRDRLQSVGEAGVLVVDRQLIGADQGSPIFGSPKSSAGIRRVPIDPNTWSILQAHLDSWAGDSMVFTSRHHGAISRTAAGDVWRTATKDMALRSRSGWHDLRHFHASMLIAGGMSPTAVAARLGHKDASETLRTYAHLWPTDDERALQIVAQTLGGVVLGRSPDGPAAE